MDICNKVLSLTKDDSFYILNLNKGKLKLYFLTDEIIRIRLSFKGTFEEESYILSTVFWEDRLDFLFNKEREKKEPINVDFIDEENNYIFKTKKYVLTIKKDPINIKLINNQGDVLFDDVEGNPFVKDSNNRINHYVKMNKEDKFYGFGEKPGKINKNQSFMKLSAKDAMGYDPINTDSLYKHIPFYIRRDFVSKKYIGLFYHNFFESSFNMGKEKSNYWPYYSVWQSDGGDIDLFLICGDDIKDIINNYTLLTGKPLFLPKRALGYQGSSMYYPELEKDSDDAVLEFIDTIKEKGFPIDGFHLSSGYTSQNNKRCVFTWNYERFKNPKDFFLKMCEKNAEPVPNVKPGILEVHPYYEKFKEKDVFIKDSENKNHPAIGKWWGGDGSFFDFTNEKARKIWKEYLKDNVLSYGTNSIWNDNCEYDSLLDKDSICDFDGKKATIGELKPIMANLMCKITLEAINEHSPNIRPYVVCRAGSSGIQKYAQTWCGDNYTSWESLKYNVSTILGMGLSGCANEGSDIGGFFGKAPEEELFVRWVQQGIFQARFSIHSTNTDNTVTEPWMYSKSTDIIRDAILFRYRMFPYLYSAMYEAHKTGAPIMRALVYEFSNDENVLDESFNYMFGRDLLISNILDKGMKQKKIYLPKGNKWYDFYTLEEYEGAQEIIIDVNINSIPMYIREGAIIPIALNQMYSMQRDIVKNMKLIISPMGNTQYTLYEDDGYTNNYLKGEYLIKNILVKEGIISKIRIEKEGIYRDYVEDYLIEYISKNKSPYWISVNGEKINHYLDRDKFEKSEIGWYYSQTRKSTFIKIKNQEILDIDISFEEFDLIGM